MTPREFRIVPPGPGTLMFPALIGVAGLCALATVLIVSKAPPQAWTGAAPAFLCVLLMPLLGLQMARRRVWLEDRGLRLHRLPWPSPVPVADFDLERAEIVDLSQRKDLKPTIKLVGSRLPGYRSGQFRLRNGARAAVVVTEQRRVLVLPRRNGSYVLLSVENGGSLLEAMRTQQARHG